MKRFLKWLFNLGLDNENNCIFHLPSYNTGLSEIYGKCNCPSKLLNMCTGTDCGYFKSEKVKT
jgi:hypothetical protein